MTSSNLVPTGRFGLAHRLFGALAQALRMIVAVLRAVSHRRDVGRLLELDDRALHDIGLVRTDVLGALAQPLVKDPSTVLLVRSIERRARVRALDVAVRRSRRPACPSGA
jgi:uncharacterized protein YjiS (DUF1127 family)